MAVPVTFYSRYKRYQLAAVATIGTIDFSGGKTPPAEGDGRYTTMDANTIAFLRSHAAYGIDFQEVPYTTPTDPGTIPIVSRETALDWLVGSIALVGE